MLPCKFCVMFFFLPRLDIKHMCLWTLESGNIYFQNLCVHFHSLRSVVPAVTLQPIIHSLLYHTIWPGKKKAATIKGSYFIITAQLFAVGNGQKNSFHSFFGQLGDEWAGPVLAPLQSMLRLTKTHWKWKHLLCGKVLQKKKKKKERTLHLGVYKMKKKEKKTIFL